MKRKSIITLVFTVMVLAILGIVLIIYTNIPVVQSALTMSNPDYTRSAVQFLVSVLLIFLCWIALLIIFIRLLKSDNFIEFGKKDALTGIGNRNYIESVFKRAGGDSRYRSFFVYFALTPKRIIAKYDTSLFDKIQNKAADALTEACNENEFVARLDEGEFAMIINAVDGLRAEERITELVNRLNQCEYKIIFEIIAPFRSGFYMIDEKHKVFSAALQNAKRAYQHAVNHLTDTFIYSEDLSSLNESNKRRAKQLTEALKNKEFDAFAQFVYDVKLNKFIGIEVLSRWNSDDGFILPGGYINDMHACGIIEDFDMYMFDKTCNILQNWKNDDDFADMLVSCNITRVTISSRAFMKNVREIVGKYDFKHENLIIEVTEDALIDDLDVAYENMLACREMGFKLALDDFGAGHSAFSDIHNYPFDQVKVDRQFAKTALTEKGVALLTAFIEMSHKLGISVVCEGVETKEQCSAVKKLQFDYIQGHYYSYVYPLGELRDRLAQPLK